MEAADSQTQVCLSFRDATKVVVKASKRFTTSLAETIAATNAFADAINSIVPLLKSDEGAIPVTWFSNFLKAEAVHQEGLLKQHGALFETPLSNFADYNFNELIELQRRCDKLKSDLFAITKKFSKGSVSSEDVEKVRKDWQQNCEKYKEMAQNHCRKMEPRFLGFCATSARIHVETGSKVNELWQNLIPKLRSLELFIAAHGDSSSNSLEGFLSQKTMLGWQKEFWTLKGSTLTAYKSRKDESGDAFEALAVKEYSGGKLSGGEMERAFEVLVSYPTQNNKKNRVLLLLASTNNERATWIQALSSVTNGRSMSDFDLQSTEQSSGSGSTWATGTPSSNAFGKSLKRFIEKIPSSMYSSSSSSRHSANDGIWGSCKDRNPYHKLPFYARKLHSIKKFPDWSLNVAANVHLQLPFNIMTIAFIMSSIKLPRVSSSKHVIPNKPMPRPPPINSRSPGETTSPNSLSQLGSTENGSLEPTRERRFSDGGSAIPPPPPLTTQNNTSDAILNPIPPRSLSSTSKRSASSHSPSLSPKPNANDDILPPSDLPPSSSQPQKPQQQRRKSLVAIIPPNDEVIPPPPPPPLSNSIDSETNEKVTPRRKQSIESKNPLPPPPPPKDDKIIPPPPPPRRKQSIESKNPLPPPPQDDKIVPPPPPPQDDKIIPPPPPPKDDKIVPPPPPPKDDKIIPPPPPPPIKEKQQHPTTTTILALDKPKHQPTPPTETKTQIKSNSQRPSITTLATEKTQSSTTTTTNNNNNNNNNTIQGNKTLSPRTTLPQPITPPKPNPNTTKPTNTPTKPPEMKPTTTTTITTNQQTPQLPTKPKATTPQTAATKPATTTTTTTTTTNQQPVFTNPPVPKPSAASKARARQDALLISKVLKDITTSIQDLTSEKDINARLVLVQKLKTDFEPLKTILKELIIKEPPVHSDDPMQRDKNLIVHDATEVGNMASESAAKLAVFIAEKDYAPFLGPINNAATSIRAFVSSSPSITPK